ncbi:MULTISPECIES: ADP-ribosyltransferase [unclassified Streptomyces]|uniref:ADP-ribosyltransferase n=1 Tax=unclassified Streptomyces TaxID=2593676 RepID=UPI0035DE72EE
MITSRLRRRAAVAVVALSAVLVPAAATATAAATAAAPAAAPAAVAFKPGGCPVVADHLFAAADPVDIRRITPRPSWRDNCRQLYRADGRGPQAIFDEGFHARDIVYGQYDLEKYVLVNQPSPFVSTTYDHDLYKRWKSEFNYYIDAPGGIDVNKTIGDTHKYADQVEVAFPGGVDRTFIVGACPIDQATKTEIMNKCVDNPHYKPWRS